MPSHHGPLRRLCHPADKVLSTLHHMTRMGHVKSSNECYHQHYQDTNRHIQQHRLAPRFRAMDECCIRISSLHTFTGLQQEDGEQVEGRALWVHTAPDAQPPITS